jgi:hypothetical protein
MKLLGRRVQTIASVVLGRLADNDKPRRTGSAAAVLLSLAMPAAAQPPVQAFAAGFTRVIFESNFHKMTAAVFARELSCAGTPQTATWKQGFWWEGQNDPNGVAPCSQIGLADDPLMGRVLDLVWTASGNTDAQNATTISTFPLDIFSPHFSFHHGYVEVVLRATPASAGTWPVVSTWSDNSVIASNTPPYADTMPSSEFDIFEGNGGFWPASLVAAIHEYPGTNGFTTEPIGTFDFTRPHTYGWLWHATAGAGEVCSYLDSQLQGCLETTSASETQNVFLNLSMGVGCNNQVTDRSCLNGLARADLFVSRITVYGE